MTLDDRAVSVSQGHGTKPLPVIMRDNSQRLQVQVAEAYQHIVDVQTLGYQARLGSYAAPLPCRLVLRLVLRL